ncbi:MAG: helix-hairpin-helix domain-containing protein [Ruminococcus sp.]|nr:helix-hairpin-helix domain-containing protein [Ruminococcus sp.]MCM1480028.1 helix-hairpin-helix domain-containing protein [Muribaculaceae bacterium]
MNSKKVGIIFVVIGLAAVSSFLLYPLLNEKTEDAVPVLKTFSDSAAPSEETSETLAETPAETLPPPEETASETVSVSSVSFPIDINAASAEELMQIKGVGETLAANIIAYRESQGYFHSAEDLLNVDGIGDKKLDAIRDYIYIDSELFPETSPPPQTSAVTETVSVPATTSVPQSHSERTGTSETTAKTTVTVTVTTEDPDDGLIIEEITDFEDFDQTSVSSPSSPNGGDGGVSYSEFEFTTEEYTPNFPLELNTATARDLAYIDGIGETLAERIVQYARSYGFYDVNDLLNVNGIGQSKLNSILPYVYVNASGLPPKTETTANSYFDPWGAGETSFGFSAETTSAAPEIYRVNVNTATKADFMQLPGIDETLADSIISLRSQIGYFATIEELSLADGMTNSRLSAIWNYIYV